MPFVSPFSFRPGRWRIVVGLILLVGAVPVRARDVYVLLSGGGTPLTNNYSQYLQARGLAGHLQRVYPADSVWVFFGTGNRDDQPAQIADVRRQVKEGGLIRESWLPGVLPRNRPARKAEFLRALREEILPAVREGGTLHLFVGDHGALARQEPRESVVTLWQLHNPTGGDRGWRTDLDEELSVTELRAALAAGLGQGRVVFCMTQCHSGGFHFLGVPRAVRPPADWFTTVPEWAQPMEEEALPLAAGFTAVDEASLAAGCDPDPDPDRWVGYERYVPEALLGLDLFSGRTVGSGLPSYAAAHEASVLIDQTIDKPRSSSEQYLERWAALVERLAGETGLQPAVQAQVEAYRRAVDAGFADAGDPAFMAKRALFGRYLARMAEQNPSVSTLLATGTRAELERAGGVKAANDAPGGRPSRAKGPPDERLKLWTDTIRPAWKTAVEAGKVKKLRGAALGFEKYLLAQEEKGRNFMFPTGWQNPMLNDLYWQSGYALPAKLDRKKAEAITRWGAGRRAAILEWARRSRDPAVKAAGEKLAPARDAGKAAPTAPRTLSRQIAAERTLFYRRVLAAWAFLLATHQDAALAQLQRLIELENTPLPASAPRPD